MSLRKYISKFCWHGLNPIVPLERRVTAWFKYENVLNAKAFAGPDLNPIKHLEEILDRCVRQHSQLPSSKHQIREYLLEE